MKLVWSCWEKKWPEKWQSPARSFTESVILTIVDFFYSRISPTLVLQVCLKIP